MAARRKEYCTGQKTFNKHISFTLIHELMSTSLSFYTNGGTGFEVFFTNNVSKNTCTLVVATITKKEFITLALNEFPLETQRWVCVYLDHLFVPALSLPSFSVSPTPTQYFSFNSSPPPPPPPFSLSSLPPSLHNSTAYLLSTTCPTNCGGSPRSKSLWMGR